MRSCGTYSHAAVNIFALDLNNFCTCGKSIRRHPEYDFHAPWNLIIRKLNMLICSVETYSGSVRISCCQPVDLFATQPNKFPALDRSFGEPIQCGAE